MQYVDPALTPGLVAWYADAVKGGFARQADPEPVADPSLPASCCPKARRSPITYFCTCMVVTECPDHGERHHGTHD